MLFAAREFHTSKDMDFPNDYEDAFCFDQDRGLATVADGVSSAIFSRQWADLLTRAVVEMPPDLYTEGVFQQWLAEQRAKWIEQIDLHNLPWNQRQKLQMVGGAFSTLLWLELYPWQSEDDEDQQDDGPAEGGLTEDGLRKFRMRCFAVGDCSLFHVRDGEILRAFPLNTAAEFDEDPISICSVNLNRDHELAFQAIDDTCLENDLLVLCSDAIGKWAMTRMEEEDAPDWESYWDRSYEEWIQEIVSLRQGKRMRYDDTTLLLLRVGAEEAAMDQPATTEPASTSSDSDERTVAVDEWEQETVLTDSDDDSDDFSDLDDTVIDDYDEAMLRDDDADSPIGEPWQLAETVEFNAITVDESNSEPSNSGDAEDAATKSAEDSTEESPDDESDIVLHGSPSDVKVAVTETEIDDAHDATLTEGQAATPIAEDSDAETDGSADYRSEVSPP